MHSSDPFSWPVRVYYEDSDAQGLVLDGDLICSGTTRAACLDADTMKPARLPDTLFEEPET